MSVYIETYHYKLNHGATPRGYGMWGFCPKDRYHDVDYLKHVMWHAGKYSDAKKSAAAYFGPKGVSCVYVCP